MSYSKPKTLWLIALCTVVIWCILIVILISGVAYELGYQPSDYNYIYVGIKLLLVVGGITAIGTIVLKCDSCGKSLLLRDRNDDGSMFSKGATTVIRIVSGIGFQCQHCHQRYK